MKQKVKGVIHIMCNMYYPFIYYDFYNLGLDKDFFKMPFLFVVEC